MYRKRNNKIYVQGSKIIYIQRKTQYYERNPMRQARLGSYLDFQAYLLAFIQRLENIMYKEVLLIRKVFQNQQEYTTFRQCGQKEIHAKSEKTQLRIWLILLLCAGLLTGYF